MTQIERPPRNTEEAVKRQTGEALQGYVVESAMGAAAAFPAGRTIENPWDIYREIAEALLAARKAARP